MTTSNYDLSAIGRADHLNRIGDAADVLVSQINTLEAGGITKMQAGGSATAAFNNLKGEVEVLRQRYFDNLANNYTHGINLTPEGLKMVNQVSSTMNADWYKLGDGTLDTVKVRSLAEPLSRLNDVAPVAPPVVGPTGTPREQATALLNSVPALVDSKTKAETISRAINLIVPRTSTTSTSTNALQTASTTVSPTVCPVPTVSPTVCPVPTGSTPVCPVPDVVTRLPVSFTGANLVGLGVGEANYTLTNGHVGAGNGRVSFEFDVGELADFKLPQTMFGGTVSLGWFFDNRHEEEVASVQFLRDGQVVNAQQTGGTVDGNQSVSFDGSFDQVRLWAHGGTRGDGGEFSVTSISGIMESRTPAFGSINTASMDSRALTLLGAFMGSTPGDDLVSLIYASSLPELQKNQLLNQAADVTNAIISVNSGDTGALNAAAAKLDVFAGSVAEAYSGGSPNPVNSIALNLANRIG